MVAALGAAVAAVRRARAVHPRGVACHATLRITGGGDSGVDLFDRAGTYSVLVRLSRGGGLPAGWPDVLGIALRIPAAAGADGGFDLLASTVAGAAPVARHLPFPRRRLAAVYTTVAGYHTRRGRRYLAVLPDPASDDLGTDLARLPDVTAAGRASFRLAVASRAGRWRVVGRITLGEPLDPQPTERLSFDPVLHRLPDLRPTGLLWRIRAAAYRGSRAGRGADRPLTSLPDQEVRADRAQHR